MHRTVSLLALLFVCLSLPSLASVASRPYERVYSIQVVAVQRAEQGRNFARQHPQIPLSCRQKSNGLYGVYYGVYASYDSARLHLRDFALLPDMGAYVVRLDNVTFTPCVSLEEQIRHSRQRARQDRTCTDCDLSGLVQQWLPNLRNLYERGELPGAAVP